MRNLHELQSVLGIMNYLGEILTSHGRGVQATEKAYIIKFRMDMNSTY